MATTKVTQSLIADDAIGADQLASNAVVNASIASGAAIDMDKLDGDSLGTAITDFAQDDLVILSDTSASGNLVKITTSNFEDAIFGNISGDATVAAGGALTIANNAIETAMINADAVDGTKIADDAINSEHYTDGSIDTAHIADDQITLAKMADDAIGADQLAANAVVNASIASGAAIDMDKLDGDSLATAITDFAQDDLVILSDTSDSGNLVKITTSNFEDAIFGNVSGDATIAAGGALTIANDAVEQAMIADDAVGADQLASNAVVTASITDDNVTHAKLEGRYTAKATSTGTGSQNLDASAATTFLLTGNVGTATLTIQNLKLGQAIDIVLSGTLSSAAITLATNFSSATIRKVGTTELDTSATNVITVVCIDDNDSAALVHYTINTFATDTTP
jgi:hypothetical protein